jgi:hypothetical protein
MSQEQIKIPVSVMRVAVCAYTLLIYVAMTVAYLQTGSRINTEHFIIFITKVNPLLLIERWSLEESTVNPLYLFCFSNR